MLPGMTGCYGVWNLRAELAKGVTELWGSDVEGDVPDIEFRFFLLLSFT